MSELYTLPDEWEWKKLGDITTVIGGGTPRTNIKEYWENGNIIWLSPTDLGNIGEIISINNSKTKITKLGLEKSSAKLLPIGTVLYSSRATIGKIAINEIEVSTNQGFTNFICKDLLLNKYLAFCLNRFTSDITDLSNSTTFKEVSKSSLKDFEIPLPPLEEQKRIVAKLDILFAKIDKAIALHQKNCEEANVFMASVLNDVFVELEEKYEIKTVYDLCTKITDGTHSTPKYIDSGVPFLSVKNISQGVISFDDTKFISMDEHNLLSKRCNVEIDDVLYTKVGTTGIAKVVDTDIEFSIFVSIALLKPKKDLINSMYFQYILNSPNCYEQSQSRTRGVANRNLVLNDIKQIFFPLPPLETQQKVVSYLDEISQKMENIKQIQKEKMQSLKALKASILDQAFKGEL
ncbi:restriction endonuclease subunit S [Aliarcobacter butzleri]